MNRAVCPPISYSGWRIKAGLYAGRITVFEIWKTSLCGRPLAEKEVKIGGASFVPANKRKQSFDRPNDARTWSPNPVERRDS
jgi:hypothetical protein